MFEILSYGLWLVQKCRQRKMTDETPAAWRWDASYDDESSWKTLHRARDKYVVFVISYNLEV